MSVDVRDSKQNQILENYLEQNKLKSTIVSGTGTGKSFIAMKLIRKLNPSKVVILVNSTVLKDSNWKAEFDKNSMGAYYEDSVIMQTYQYMYKQTEDILDLDQNALLILDEVDFIADTDELSKVINLYPFTRTIGLTGFITETKKEWFKRYLPVIEEYSSSDAQDDGLLNKIQFVFVKYDLSRDPRGVKVTYKKGGAEKHFYQSENAAYEYRQKKFGAALGAKQALDKEFAQGKIDLEQFTKKLKSADYKINMASRERSNLLLNCLASAKMSKDLLGYIQSQDVNSKTIVFSKRTQQSLNICGETMVYNGKIPKKKANENFDKFKSGEINTLGVCDKINRGANIDGLNNAIFETFNSSDTDATQRFGRMLRLDPDKEATVYILLPYYLLKLVDDTYKSMETQQVKWARNMIRSTALGSYKIWDYRSIKT